MWKYCIEIEFCFVRDYKNYFWSYDGFINYVEQRYFKTKAEAKKGMIEAVREYRKWMTERKEKIGYCHHKVIVERHNDRDYANVFLYDRFDKFYDEQIMIKFITL